MSAAEPLVVERRPDGVASITFNRPKLRNALDADQWDNLALALSTLQADESVKCVVLTGAGEVFAAGGDLKSLLAELADADGPTRFRERIHRSLRALYEFRVPTIAKVNGPAIGGGLELAIACDIRIASESARFAMPAARFGMVMARHDFARLASIVGIDRARFLAMTGEIIDGKEAFRIGLVHQVTAPAELDGTTERMTRRILGMEPEAIAWFRRAATSLETGRDLEPLRDFEETCLRRDEFRRRVEEFMRR